MTNLSTLQKQVIKTTSDVLKQLSAIRQQIVDCDEECEWLRSMPLPLEDALGNIDRFIKKIAPYRVLTNFFMIGNCPVVHLR